MKISFRLFFAACFALVAGCATPPQQIQDLTSENTSLRQTVRDQQFQIKTLTDDKTHLQTDLDYCTKRSEVLDKEKSARIDEAAAMRKGVREFTDQVTTSLQTYFQRAEIVDYIGSELLPRASTDSLKNMLLVDMNNPVKNNGTVIGARAWLSAPARAQFCLVRRDEKEGRYSVVAITPPVAAADAGLQSWTFDVPLAARKGDYIAVYMPDDVSISYDDVDTGEVVAVPGPVKMNGAVTLNPAKGRNKRAYSFGVVGYFDATAAPADATPETEPAK